jgi:hypothetical protein
MSCTLIFTAGAKGGSGKTTAARFLITYLRDRGRRPLILDLDDENHTLSRFFPEAVQIGIQREFAHDILIEKAIFPEHDIILADLKAGTGHEVLRWFLELPFGELTEGGVEFVCVGSVKRAPGLSGSGPQMRSNGRSVSPAARMFVSSHNGSIAQWLPFQRANWQN